MGGHCLEETAADDRNKSTMLEKFSIKHYLRKEQWRILHGAAAAVDSFVSAFVTGFFFYFNILKEHFNHFREEWSFNGFISGAEYPKVNTEVAPFKHFNRGSKNADLLTEKKGKCFRSVCFIS